MVRVSIRIRVRAYTIHKVLGLQMLNNKPHYGKINYTYTLVSSGGHIGADDQTKPYSSCCHLLTMRTVD